MQPEEQVNVRSICTRIYNTGKFGLHQDILVT